MSRTWAARSENSSFSVFGLPKSLTSVAPPAENLSVIRVDMLALLSAAWNWREASLPLSIFVGMMNSGSSRIDMTVTCQEMVTITPTVRTRETKFDTMPESVLEKAR